MSSDHLPAWDPDKKWPPAQGNGTGAPAGPGPAWSTPAPAPAEPAGPPVQFSPRPIDATGRDAPQAQPSQAPAPIPAPAPAVSQPPQSPAPGSPIPGRLDVQTPQPPAARPGWWAPATAEPTRPRPRGIIPSLFDTSFDTLITPRLIVWIYRLSLITIVGGTLFAFTFMWSLTAWDVFFAWAQPIGWAGMVLCPLGGLIALMVCRVMCETALMKFKRGR